MNEEEWLASEDLQALIWCAGRTASARKMGLFAVACCREMEHLLTDTTAREAINFEERYADGQATYPDRLRMYDAVERIPDSTPPGYRRYAVNAVVEMLSQDVVQHRSFYTAGHAATAIKESSREPFSSIQGRQIQLLRDIVGNPFRPLPRVRWWDPSECRVCGNTPNAEGWIEHSRGCCQLDPDGGGGEAAEEVLGPWLTWRDGTVLRLARAIYDEWAFSTDRMGILADALEEAGCDHADILDHLRGPGPDLDPTPWEHRERTSNDLAVIRREMDQRLRGPVHVRGCWVIDLLTGRE